MEPNMHPHFWTKTEISADFWASVYIFSFIASQKWPDYKFGYDLETEQFWVLGSHEDERSGISYYGMTVETAIGFEPYRVTLGGLEMGGYDTFFAAFTAMTTVLRNTIAVAQWHMDAVGGPCNDSCNCWE
jgi:hypothetical protein